MENFDRPYLSVGFGEFWRRWHISLSTWIPRAFFKVTSDKHSTPSPSSEPSR